MGLVKLLQIIWALYIKKKNKNKDNFTETDMFGTPSERNGSAGSSLFIEIVISLFLFVWFCFGNHWVIKIWWPNFKQPREIGSSRWCSRDAYMLAIISIVVCYSLAVLFLVLVFIIFIYSKFCKPAENSDQISF